MTEHAFHQNRFLEINKQTIVEVKSFCFINELLEKVVTDKITNPESFLNGSEPILEEFLFEFPDIPSGLNLLISSYKVNKYDFQCK